ncbi:MAG TPA: ATP-binding protein [Burkholderiales bacterium]|nr:ATP-binding protein [Burkholderiales bacterium]
MPNTAADLSSILQRAESVLHRLEAWLPAPPEMPEWDRHIAFRWRRQGSRGWLEGIDRPQVVAVSQLTGIDAQKQSITQNTAQFVAGKPANNVLLTGARGTGKSSLVKAMLHAYSKQGLRMIEVDKDYLADLADITRQLVNRPERFILFCDDLSFSDEDPGYKSLKVALDGTLAAAPENVLIYATSNRRHLLPEYMRENEAARHQNGEVHPNEATEEKISLSERFGLWLSFYPFDQDTYLASVAIWLESFGIEGALAEESRREALQWALTRGTRSGRSAWQFARDYVGRKTLPE